MTPSGPWPTSALVPLGQGHPGVHRPTSKSTRTPAGKLFEEIVNKNLQYEAKILLNNWIEKNPSDDNAQELLDEILQLESS